MWPYQVVLVFAVAYIAVVAVMYAGQTQMLFPTRQATASGPPLPTSATRLEVETPDGVRLRGVHIPPARDRAGERLVVLGFDGNAWNDTVTPGLAEFIAERDSLYLGTASAGGQPYGPTAGSGDEKYATAGRDGNNLVTVKVDIPPRALQFDFT